MAAEVGHEVDPVCIFPRRPYRAHLVGVKLELSTYLQTSRAERVRLRSRQPLSVLFDDEAFD